MTKGKMWCPSCGKPVLAVKNTHRARNTASILGAPFSGGLSLIGVTRDPYFCPDCGTKARRRRSSDRLPDERSVTERVEEKRQGAIDAEAHAASEARSRARQREGADERSSAELIRAEVEEMGGTYRLSVYALCHRFRVPKRTDENCRQMQVELENQGLTLYPAALTTALDKQSMVGLSIDGFTPQAAVAPLAEAAQPATIRAELERLGQMSRDGLLTEEEFAAAKRKLLDLPAN
jgi:predicted RNA-binding Zn-ribbon protein involved in translation (DUF1610 family)